MTQLDERIMMDLGSHFHDRLRVLLDDVATSAAAVDLDMGAFAQVLFTVLLAETAIGGVSTHCPEERFVAVAREAWRLARHEQAKRIRRAQQ